MSSRSSSAIRALVLALGASVLLLVVSGGGVALAAKEPKSPAAALKALVKQTGKVPASAAPRAQRRRLARIARHASKSVKRKPCTSVADMERFRKALNRIKVRGHGRGAQKLAALGPASLVASRLLLSSPRTSSCGGGIKPSPVDHTKMKVLDSDENGLTLQVTLPDVNFVPETGGGDAWTKLTLPNTDSPSTPGTPGIPVAGETFAVPDGATLSVKTSGVESYKLGGVEVFPAQPDVVDDEPPPDFLAPPFIDAPFTKDKAAYNHDGLVPAQPATGDVLGASRDVTIGGLQVPAAQYDANDGILKVLTSLEIKLNFNGGTHTFSEELASPWEASARSFLATLLNFNIVKSRVAYPFRRCGEEMLVITNPATLAAADQFATARRAAGIRTSVFQTGAAAGQIGTTTTAIQSFIRGRLTAFLCIHPSYVTIMGDDDLVPTFPGINGIPSDLQYSMKNDTDELPDVAVGRIIGNDQTQVAAAVTKIIGYETTPPSSGDFLTHALIAAQFQDDNADGREERTFTQFAETVRTGLVGRGVAVDRVYRDSPTTTPLKFNDGTDLPAALKKPTFPWTGTGADITAGWNAGRFMVVHRDHGWSDGWSTPGFGTADVNALTNGSKLPVLLSINCSSGAYDYDETSFAGSALVKPDGGAVGVFGDTRDSPTWHNTQIALGFVDAMLPSVLPGEGPALKQRVGNALISGKLRLAGLAPPATDGSTRNELYLWHYFGDPSMQMWGGGQPPLYLDPNLFQAVFSTQITNPPPGDPPPYQVNVTLPAGLAGQPISLVRDGQVIGKTVAGDGVATIPAEFGDGSVKAGHLQVSMEAEGSPPLTIPVSNVPKENTTLTKTCPPSTVPYTSPVTTSGTLGPSVANATISIKYTPPSNATNPTPFTRTVTTDANGGWTDSINVPGSDTGTWTIEPSFAGNNTHNPSSTTPCSVTVYDPNS